MRTNEQPSLQILLRSCAGERGATAVEYALLASLIAAVIAGVVGTLGSQVYDLFSTVAGEF